MILGQEPPSNDNNSLKWHALSLVPSTLRQMLAQAAKSIGQSADVLPNSTLSLASCTDPMLSYCFIPGNRVQVYTRASGNMKIAAGLHTLNPQISNNSHRKPWPHPSLSREAPRSTDLKRLSPWQFRWLLRTRCARRPCEDEPSL